MERIGLWKHKQISLLVSAFPELEWSGNVLKDPYPFRLRVGILKGRYINSDWIFWLIHNYKII